MFATLLLALAPAHADRIAESEVEAPCGTWVDPALPLADAVDVPVDVAPAFSVTSCGSDTVAHVWIAAHETGDLAFDDVIDLPSNPMGLGQVVDLPALDLAPDTTYDLFVESEDFGVLGGWSFTTGERTAEDLGAPDVTLQIEDATAYENGVGFSGSLWVWADTALENPVRLTSPDVPGLAVPLNASTTFVSVQLDELDACFVPEVRAETGAWVAGPEVCTSFTLEPEWVCGTTWLGCSSTGFGGLVLGPLPLLFLRRRRA
ncbi:MAG: hypothetical protein H6736_05340 [Alphaproteobacteria bacterium]|nr:hypothetical protein [Alphaproteobacteria bacterium]MCB9691222.1 hypothetical protein [Alphaproteobacteria bacterium]